MQKASVLPAQGIGDALLMLIASYSLQEAGFEVTTYQPMLTQLEPWLRNRNFLALPPLEQLEAQLYSDKIVILQNDNSEIAKFLIKLRSEGKLNNLAVFYPTYKPDKHGTLSPDDIVFEEDLCMVENIAKATSKLLKLAGVSRNNGLTPLPSLVHRKYIDRVIIHPTSSQLEKNWPAKKFLALASKLKKKGFKPVFAVSPNEHGEWSYLVEQRYELPLLPTLSDLASLVYESGYVIGNDSLIGHLASNMQIPSIIVANEEKRMRLWRPGWLKGEVITPASFLLKWPFFSKDKHWGSLISVRKVLERFQKVRRSF